MSLESSQLFQLARVCMRKTLMECRVWGEYAHACIYTGPRADSQLDGQLLCWTLRSHHVTSQWSFKSVLCVLSFVCTHVQCIWYLEPLMYGPDDQSSTLESDCTSWSQLMALLMNSQTFCCEVKPCVAVLCDMFDDLISAPWSSRRSSKRSVTVLHYTRQAFTS